MNVFAVLFFRYGKDVHHSKRFPMTMTAVAAALIAVTLIVLGRREIRRVS